VWDKTGGLDSAQTSDCELIWTNVDKPTRVFRHLWRGLIRAGAENVALQPKHHPHQKPVALMVWLMDYLGLPADALICDPYAGSGTTGVACLKSGRRCILIERDERYIPVIIKRLEAAETPLLSAIEAAPSESPCLWGDQDP
jgi:DNA modification methylase